MVISTTQPDQQTWVLELSGKLNFPARQSYQQAVKQAEAASPRHIMVDMTQVTYIDSAGLGLLALSHKSMAKAGIKISLINPQEPVLEVLELTNIKKMFPVYDSVTAASHGFKTKASIGT